MTDRPTAGGVTPIFLEIAPADIALVKFLFESYEGVAVIRTIDQRAATIVAIVSRDFEDVARGMLESLRGSVAFREVPAPAGAAEVGLLGYAVADPADAADDAGPATAPSCGGTFQRSQT